MTVGLELNHKERTIGINKGLHLIMIRVTHKRKLYRSSSEIYVKKQQFNKKAKYGHWIVKHLDAYEINEALKQKITSVERIYQLGEEVTPQQALLHDSYFKFADQFIEKYNNEDHKRTYDSYRSRIAKLKKYAGEGLKFSDVTVKFIRDYSTYLAGKEKGNHINSIAVDLRKIRAIINQAIKEDLFPYAKNPFLKISIETKKTSKEKLTSEELDLIRKYKCDGYLLDAKNIFLFCVNCMGMRIGAALKLKKSQINKGWLHYQADKGGKTKNIELTKEAVKIVNHYSGEGEYLFPYLEGCKNENDAIKTKTSLINKGLKSIATALKLTKHVSTHVARHSFSRMALEKGVSIRTLQGMLSHTSVKTTEDYAGDILDIEGNEALKKIFG